MLGDELEGDDGRRCRLCNSSLKKTGAVCGDRADIAVVKCAGCDLIQLEDFSHIDRAYYASSEYSGQDAVSSRAREQHWNDKRVAKIREILPEAGSLAAFDFGCGHGGFLEAAQGLFRSLIGFDLSPIFCMEHKHQGWRSVNRLAEVPQDIEVIVVFHVLEHVQYPWKLLGELVKTFSRVQKLVIEVPHTGEALNALFENAAYRKNHYCSDHLYYFTHTTFRQVMAAAQLEVLFETELQRYSLANTLGWLARGSGGGQSFWGFLDDPLLNAHYERVLVQNRMADSILAICQPRRHNLYEEQR